MGAQRTHSRNKKEAGEAETGKEAGNHDREASEADYGNQSGILTSGCHGLNYILKGPLRLPCRKEIRREQEQSRETSQVLS